MKRKHLITVFMWCVATTLCAQTPVEKGLKSINRQAAEAYIGFWPMMNYRDVKPDSTVRVWLPGTSFPY